MQAYHNDPAIKADILAQLAAHRKADEIVKGQYWEHGRGCAVGCTLHSADHAEYEARFGIPQMLARLEDCIFEGLPNHKAKRWPERFMSAIEPGCDLSLVGWLFLHWILTDKAVNPGIDHPMVRDAVRECADVIAEKAKGHSVAADAVENAENAENAARSAADAARSAADAAWNAEGAESARSAAWSAWSAESVANAARSAADAAWNAEGAASAESAARSAAWSAERSAERSATYVLMADKLIELFNATR